MLQRHTLRRAYLLGSLLLLAASLHAPTAYSAVGDPPTGSPAGAVYELPLERGRSDGAPKLGGGGGAGGGGGGGNTAAGGGPGEAGSLYRSENNFGSSSQVPGIAAAGGAGAGVAAGAAGGGGDSGGPGGGDGGSAAAPGALARNEIADAGNTSVSASVVLLAAIALLAGAIGVLSRRFS